MLRLYIDSADRSAVERWLATGLLHGVTTNPTLLERAGVAVGELASVHAWAVGAGAREVFLQVWGREEAVLTARGRELAALGPEVIVKVPATEPGLRTAVTLTQEGIRVLLTAVYTPGQAVLAAAAGVDSIAPYLGRLTDAGVDGLGVIARMQRVLGADGGRTRVLAASLRSPGDVLDLLDRGVTCFTLGPTVLEQLLTSPATDAAAEVFEQATLGAGS